MIRTAAAMPQESTGQKTQRSRACPSRALPRSRPHFSHGTAFVCSCSLHVGQCKKLRRYVKLATSSIRGSRLRSASPIAKTRRRESVARRNELPVVAPCLRCGVMPDHGWKQSARLELAHCRRSQAGSCGATQRTPCESSLLASGALWCAESGSGQRRYASFAAENMFPARRFECSRAAEPVKAKPFGVLRTP